MEETTQETTQKNDKFKRRMKTTWEITKIVGWFLGSLITMAVFGTPIITDEELKKEEEEEARRKAKEERERQEREEAERIRRASLTPEQRKIEDLEKELARTNRRCDALQNKINRQDEIIDQQQRENRDMDYAIREMKGEIF